MSEPETYTSTDAELMARTANGDREAFGDLVNRYKDDLVTYLSRLSGSFERAEDLAQEAFLRLFNAAPSYQEQGQLNGFLFRIATNLLRSEERSRRRWRWVPFPEPGTSPDLLKVPIRLITSGEEATASHLLLRKERVSELARAVAALPMAYRVPLVLYEIEDWSLGEIAECLDCRPGTVKSRLFRARRKLRKALGAEEAPGQGESL